MMTDKEKEWFDRARLKFRILAFPIMSEKKISPKERLRRIKVLYGKMECATYEEIKNLYNSTKVNYQRRNING